MMTGEVMGMSTGRGRRAVSRTVVRSLSSQLVRLMQWQVRASRPTEGMRSSLTWITSQGEVTLTLTVGGTAFHAVAELPNDAREGRVKKFADSAQNQWGSSPVVEGTTVTFEVPYGL